MSRRTEVSPEDDPVLIELLAKRVGLTEGQLYTVVISLLGLLLVVATGLPNAGRVQADPAVAPPISSPPVTSAPTTTVLTP